MPLGWSGPVTVRPSGRAPHGLGSPSRRGGPGGRRRLGGLAASRDVTGHRDRGKGQEGSGVGEVGLDHGVQRGDRRRGRPASGWAPRRRRRRRGGAAARRSSRCAASKVPACRRAARRRPCRNEPGQQQRRDELRGRGGVDDDLAAGHGRRRRGPRTAARPGLVVDRDPETASAVSTSPTGRLRMWASPSKDTPRRQRGDRRYEPEHGAGQSAVDLGVAVEGRGVTAQSSPEVSTPAPRPVRAAAISTVSRERRARRTSEGPSASAASTSARLVSDLLPGSDTVGVDRPARARRRPRSTYVVTRRSLRHTIGGRGAMADPCRPLALTRHATSGGASSPCHRSAARRPLRRRSRRRRPRPTCSPRSPARCRSRQARSCRTSGCRSGS